MGTLIPALPASGHCCEKVKEKMNTEVFGGQHCACVLCSACVVYTAAASGNNNSNGDDDNKHFRNTGLCTGQCGKLYRHDLNDCPKQADE